MPVMTYSATVNANTTVADVFNTKLFHTAQKPSRYRLYARHASAAGTVVSAIRHGRTIDGEEIDMAAAAGAPVIPDDLIAESILRPGEQYKVDLKETGGVNTATKLKVVIDEA
jgi:hypothetical protein